MRAYRGSAFRSLCNGNVVLTIDGREYVLGAGSQDHVFTFEDREPGLVYVLSYNRPLSYASLEIIDIRAGEVVGEIFVQNTDELKLRRPFFSYTEQHMAKVLAQFVIPGV